MRSSAYEPEGKPLIETPVAHVAPTMSTSNVCRFELSGAVRMSRARAPAGAFFTLIVNCAGPRRREGVAAGVAVGDAPGGEVGAWVGAGEGAGVPA